MLICIRMGQERMGNMEGFAGLDLESVRYFVIAAKLKNVRAASEALGVSQSTVSRRIQSLETGMGARLLIRRPEGVSMTDVGRRVLAAAHDLDTVSKRVASISDGLARDAVLTVSASDGIGGYWLPILLAEFPHDHPGITVKVQCRDVTRLNPVHVAEADVEVTYYPPTDPDTCVLGKGTLPMRMFSSPGYVRRYGMPHTLEETALHRACALDAYFERGLGNGDWDAYADVLATHKDVAFRVNSAISLGFAIRSGWGVGVQPAMVEATEPGMFMLPEDIYRSDVVFWLVVHKDLKDNPAPRLLAAWIKDRMIRSFSGGKATFEPS